METERRTVFVSSCTRRQMARRRATRGALRGQLFLAVIVLAVALGSFVAARGGL